MYFGLQSHRRKWDFMRDGGETISLTVTAARTYTVTSLDRSLNLDVYHCCIFAYLSVLKLFAESQMEADIGSQVAMWELWVP
jgi:hypothetical protein